MIKLKTIMKKVKTFMKYLKPKNSQDQNQQRQTSRPTSRPTARPTSRPTARPTARTTARPTARPASVLNEKEQAFKKYSQLRSNPSLNPTQKKNLVNSHVNYMLSKKFITPSQKQTMSM